MSQMDQVLELSGFSVAYGQRTVLKSVDFSVPVRGCTVLMGPSGTGKSTLVRTLAGLNQNNPTVHCQGSALYQARPLGERGWPALLLQKASLLISSVQDNLCTRLVEREIPLTRAEKLTIVEETAHEAGQAWLLDKFDTPVVELPLIEQRLVAILREWLALPALLILDEPTTGMPAADADRMIELLHWLRERTALLAVLHHQVQARNLGDQIVLLASGRVQEATPVEQFFSAPTSASGQHFIRSGSCPEESEEDDEPAMALTEPDVTVVAEPVTPAEPATDASPWAVRDAVDPAGLPPLVIRSPAMGPRGFVWLFPGEVGGTPWPGIVRPVEDDLNALRNVGIRQLVSLTEEPFPAGHAEPYGIAVAELPMPDMDVPTIAEAQELCVNIDTWRANRVPVAVHCRAGLGRTGTMLACYWLWDGRGQRTALQAIEHIRYLENGMIQSSVQVEFLDHFASHVQQLLNDEMQI